MPTKDEHILTELVKLNTKLQSLCDNVNELTEKHEVLTHLLTGNGSPERGLIVRVDRIEQDAKHREVWLKAAIGSSVAATIGLVVTLVKAVLR